MNERNQKIWPMTLHQLASSYNVSKKVMSNWIKPFEDQVGERIGRLYTPKQVETIFEVLGPPPNMD